MGKKLKNKDIAARLGLSGTLVSLVLNNKADQHGIKKETQERVLAAARQMGYFNTTDEKNIAASVVDKPGVIGMIVPSMNDPFIYEITPYFQKAFASIGYGFSVFSKDADDLRFGRFITSLKKFFSGMIIVGDAADDNTVRMLNKEEYPLVLIEKSLKRIRLNTVCSDTQAGVSVMIEHLASLGYKNLVVVSTEEHAWHDKAISDAIKDETDKLKNFDSVQSVKVRMPEPGEKFESSGLDAYLKPPFRTDVIVSVNSALVFPLLLSLNARGIRIPQDVALVSMEDGIGFDLLTTPITRIRKPLSNMALKASNIMWSEIKNKGKGKYKRQVNLSPELVIRSSCGSYLK